MTSVEGASGAPTPSEYHQYDEPLDMDEVNVHLQEEIFVAQDSYMERIADLERQIEMTDDSNERWELTAELENLKDEFDEFKAEVDDLTSNADPQHIAETWDETRVPQLEEVIDNFRDTIAESFQEFGTAGTSAEFEEGKLDWDPVDLDEVFEPVLPDSFDDILDCSIDTDESSEAGSTSGTDEQSETSGSGDTEPGDDPGPEEMVDLLQNDPDAFYDQLEDMDAQDRQDMMVAVQNQLQQMNQMFQMISQFQQVMHDTQSAVIQNMRV